MRHDTPSTTMANHGRDTMTSADAPRARIAHRCRTETRAGGTRRPPATSAGPRRVMMPPDVSRSYSAPIEAGPGAADARHLTSPARSHSDQSTPASSIPPHPSRTSRSGLRPLTERYSTTTAGRHPLVHTIPLTPSPNSATDQLGGHSDATMAIAATHTTTAAVRPRSCRMTIGGVVVADACMTRSVRPGADIVVRKLAGQCGGTGLTTDAGDANTGHEHTRSGK